ncbi:MAG: hypothetical protein ACK4GT_11830 [Pararhodobacter sp.]
MKPTSRSDLTFAPGRGAAALLVLAVIAGIATLAPLRGDLLGLLTGIGGALAVTLVLPHPERHPLLALGWSTLAFTLPVALVFTEPGLPLGASFAMGAAGAWTILSLAACRRLPNA